MRARHVALGLLLLVFDSSPVAAREPDPADQPAAAAPEDGDGAPEVTSASGSDAQAAAHFVAGVRAMEAGRHEEAYAELQKAWRLKQHFQIAANLGAVEVQLGQHRDAAEHFAYFLREARGAGVEVRPGDIRDAEQMLAEARRHVGALDLEVKPSGAEIFVDGQPAGKAPLRSEIFVKPGKRTVEVRLAGFESERTVVDAAAGTSRQLQLALQPAGQARGDALTPRRKDATQANVGDAGAERVYWPAIAAGGLALVGIGAGVGFTIAANGRAGKADEMLREAAAETPRGQRVCPSSGRCGELTQVLKENDRYEKVAVAGYVVGGIAAVTAAGFAIWPPQRAGRGLEARVAPSVSLEGGGLLVKGTF